MSKTQDKAAIIQIIQNAVANYENLVGQTYLYVFENRYIEVTYRRKDFMHLTGVDCRMAAEQFYRNIKDGILKPNQIFFNQRHPYDLCKKKSAFLSSIPLLTNTDILVLEDLTTSTFTYRFGLTDVEFVLCLSLDYDDNGVPKSEYYIARSLRAGDEFDKSQKAYEINLIFSKRNDEKVYQNVLYDDGKCKMESLSSDILQKLDSSLYEKKEKYSEEK